MGSELITGGWGMMRRWVAALATALSLAACGETSDERLVRPPTPSDVFLDDLPGQIFTRGPGGEVVVGADYAAPGDVFLYGTGLPDGAYYFAVVDFDCTRLLAGPLPEAAGVPDTSVRTITVQRGVFGAVPLAPFELQESASDFYRVYMTPVTEYTVDEASCFGFHRLTSATTVFQVDPTGAPPASPPQPSPVEPRQ